MTFDLESEIKRATAAPLCRDCKWCVPSDSFNTTPFFWWRKGGLTENSWKYSKCSHEKNERDNFHLVTGQPSEPKNFCCNLRQDYKYQTSEWCGKDGKWFEPRKLEGIEIPESIRKPVSGPCVHCGADTEDKHCGEFLHDDCNDALVDEQREDERLDSPVHDQCVNGIFRG